MPLQESLACLRKCRRLESRKPRTVAGLGRPVMFSGPNGPGSVRVLRQFGLAATDPYVVGSVKAHGLPPGGTDLENDDVALGVIHEVNFESRIGPESRPEPRKQVLVPLTLDRVRVEVRPCDLTGPVLDPEDQIALRLIH